MRAWRTVWLMAALGCVVACASAGEQPPSSGRPPRINTSAESGRAFWGMMGQVARPGVYGFPSGAVSLADLVGEAGGLTANATGNIRIIRGGRAGLQTFFSPTAEYELQAGDVVIASERTPHRGLRNSAGQSGVSPSPEAIQVALVGLLDRPVVLKVSRPYATIGGIVSSLGQRTDAVSDVLEPPTARIARSETGRPAEGLPTGTVLVLDSQAVNSSRVPHELPKPYLVGTQSGERVLADASPLPPSTADRSAAAAEFAPDHAASTRPLSALAAPGPAIRAGDEGLSVPTALGGSLRQTASESPAEPAIASESNSSAADRNAPPQWSRDSGNRPSRSESARAEGDVSRPETSASVASGRAAAEKQSARQSATPIDGNWDAPKAGDVGVRRPIVLVASLVIGLLLVGSLLVWLLGRREPLPAIEEVPEPESVRNSLEDLIQDELPIIEEHVRLPASITLHGTPKKVAPVRIDSPQAVNPPHQRAALARTDARPVEIPAEAAATSPPSATGAVKRYRMDGPRGPVPEPSNAEGEPSQAVPEAATTRETPSPTSVLERALLRVHGGSPR